MKALQRRGMRASLVYEQIFVNGRPYDETRVERPNPGRKLNTNYPRILT